MNIIFSLMKKIKRKHKLTYNVI